MITKTTVAKVRKSSNHLAGLIEPQKNEQKRKRTRAIPKIEVGLRARLSKELGARVDFAVPSALEIRKFLVERNLVADAQALRKELFKLIERYSYTSAIK